MLGHLSALPHLQPGTLPSLGVVAAWLGLMYLLRYTGYTIALLSLAATWLHEMSHFVFGFLLRAKPVSFSMMPVRAGNQWVLGSVGFANLNIWNAAFVAFAPLTLIFVGAGTFQIWLVPAYLSGNYVECAGFGYLVACCLFGCLPSSVDVRAGAASALMYGTILLSLLLAFR